MDKIILSPANASKTNNGIFEGWGTSLCWWANRIGFSKQLTEKSAELFFSEKGLNLNILRYNIGGGDDPSHNHITRTDSEMPGWWKYDKDSREFIFNSDTDKNQLNVLKECCKAAGEDAYVEAFSNSPPYYMTVSGCTSGSVDCTSNNLKEEFIDSFAEYLVDVCSFIKSSLGISIKSLAPMNEPFTDFWQAYSGKQEGCYIPPGRIQSKVLISVKNKLKEKQLDNTILTASDETNTFLQYITAKMLSKVAFSAVDRFSTHTYGKATAHIGELARKHNKNIWMDESDWSGAAGENAGEMSPALWLAEKIIDDMNVISPSAWVIWQIVASYISRIPDSKGRYDMSELPDLSKGFWGTAFADIDRECILLSQKYYAFGQFTRYIRPGMTVIHTGNSYSLGAYDNAAKMLVLVTVNSESSDKDIIIDTAKFDIDFKKIVSIRTSGNIKDGEHWKELPESPISSEIIYTSIKANSITTFIIT